jgi:chromosome segregation ATPase
MPSIEESVEAGAIKAIESPKFSERISSIFTGKLSTELTEARTAIVSKDSEIAKLKADLGAAQEEAKTAKAALETAKGEHIKALDAKEKDLDARANKIAGEKMAKAGHKPLKEEINDDPANAGEEEIDSLRTQMRAETDPKKRMALARQCREARGHKDLLAQGRN